eukprot:1142301-Pelagomonas_calceolata.AAC.3
MSQGSQGKEGSPMVKSHPNFSGPAGAFRAQSFIGLATKFLLIRSLCQKIQGKAVGLAKKSGGSSTCMDTVSIT